MNKIFIAVILIACLLQMNCAGTSRKLLLADKLTEFQDSKPIPEPKAEAPNQYYDILDKSIFKQIHAWFDVPRHIRTLFGVPKQAINVDAFDEVPNSSWFTNRAYHLSLEEAIAIGDGIVDIGMIKRAGLGIAIKATDEVKKQADVVSENLRIILDYI